MFRLTERWHPPPPSPDLIPQGNSSEQPFKKAFAEYVRWSAPPLKKAERAFPLGADGPGALLAWADLRQLHFTGRMRKEEGAGSFSPWSWRPMRPCVSTLLPRSRAAHLTLLSNWAPPSQAPPQSSGDKPWGVPSQTSQRQACSILPWRSGTSCMKHPLQKLGPSLASQDLTVPHFPVPIPGKGSCCF